LHSLVQQIRSTEQAFGDGIKQRSTEEGEMVQKGRLSIVATTDIESGVSEVIIYFCKNTESQKHC